jgi:D-glycero-alpha-D-manno-heptose-7-phosphate kinase
MIISRTPFRISFFGGGTDYPDWYREHGGAVLSTTFDKYSYISCRELPPFFDHKHRIAYSKLEYVNEAREIEHPAIRGIFNELNISKGMEIHCDADLPARSGLGSSSSFVVGMLQALKAQQGEYVTKEWLAKEAIRIEQSVLGECVGSQDQIAAAYGGFNFIEFERGGTFSVNPLNISLERAGELNDHLLLFFTGFSRIASNIAKSKVANFAKRQNELRAIRAQVDEAIDILCGKKRIEEFGILLNQGWQLKRNLSDKVSNEQIDKIYEKAKSKGALGGKILGAGGGGFMLIFAFPDDHEKIKKELNEFIHVPFRFDNTGADIIYNTNLAI